MNVFIMEKILKINNFNYKNKLPIFLYMTIFKILQIHDFFFNNKKPIFNISFYNPLLLPDKIPSQKKKKKISYIIFYIFQNISYLTF